MLSQPSRRRFLQTAPLAAAALPFSEETLHAQKAHPESFKLVSGSQIQDALAELKAKPGNLNLFETTALPFAAVLTLEQNKAAKEFEWHEGRDHLLQVLDGSTVYEVGGTPQGGHSPKPGEWLAPVSVGATKMTLGKGDWLIIPRNTPHKRSTAESVSFVLISPSGAASGK